MQQEKNLKKKYTYTDRESLHKQSNSGRVESSREADEKGTHLKFVRY